jgi:hypothetical protein
MRQFAAIGLLLVFVSACNRMPELPQGVQTLEGVLSPAEFSLSRRGTHVLSIDGKETYYVESRIINLYDHESHDITIKGTLEHNSDPKDLPVLIVQDVVDPEGTFRVWLLGGLGIEVSVPGSWTSNIQTSIASFTASGARIPALSVFEQPASGLPFTWADAIANNSDAITPLSSPVLDRQALAEQDSARQLLTVYVPKDDAGETILTFQFSERGMENVSDSEKLIGRIIDSVEASGGGSPASAMLKPVVSASGSVQGAPCGGTAGILCPTGFYCEITDQEHNVGRCVSL